MVASSIEARLGRPTTERVDSAVRGWEGKSGVRKTLIPSRLPTRSKRRRWAIGTVCSILASTVTVKRRRRPAKKPSAAMTMAMGVWRRLTPTDDVVTRSILVVLDATVFLGHKGSETQNKSAHWSWIREIWICYIHF
jgi:hypothetical protein